MNIVSAPVAPPSQSTASRSTASKDSSNLGRSWPPSACRDSLDHGLHLHTIMASQCISKLARLLPPSAALSSHALGLQVHLQTRLIMASEYISQFTRSGCETVELSRHPKRICGKERYWLKEGRKRVRGYEGIPGREEPHKLHESIKARQECVGPRAGKDRVCIL